VLARYLEGGHAPPALTLPFRQRDGSPRWKQIVAPAPGRLTHDLEMHSKAEIDDELRSWLQAAWEATGCGST